MTPEELRGELARTIHAAIDDGFRAPLERIVGILESLTARVEVLELEAQMQRPAPPDGKVET